MNIRQMIEAVVATSSEGQRPRDRAALELGARLALECAKAAGGYKSDVEGVLKDLDGIAVATPAKAVAAPADDPAISGF